MSGETEVLHAPFSLEAEQSVLGGMLIDPERIIDVAGELAMEDFYRDAHRRLFRAMLWLWEAGRVVEPVTLTERLKAVGDVEATGGAAYLAHLWDYVPTSANLEHHVRIVASHSHRRRLLAQAAAVIAMVNDHPESAPERLQADAEAMVGAAAPTSDSSGNPGLVRLKDMLWPAMEEIERLADADPKTLGVKTGLTELDDRLLSLQKGDLVVVAGRPSMGKSALGVCNMAAHAAIREQRKVAIFSIETRRQAVVNRLIGSEARVNMHALRKRGRPGDHDYPRLAQAAGLLNTAQLYIDHTPGLTLDQMRLKLRQFLRSSDGEELGLVVVDYLQMMTHPGAKNDYAEVSAISSGLKRVASEFEVPVVALSQLSRAVESRADKRPMLSDLRESGKLEQDADVVILVYRPEYYFGPRMKVGTGKQAHEITVEGKAELILAKVREGDTGSAHVGWEKEYTHFEDWGGSR